MNRIVTSPPVIAAASIILFTVLACNIGTPRPGSGPEGSVPAPAASGAPGGGPPPTSPPVTHLVQPVQLPTDRNNHAGDYDSSTTARQNEAPGGDRFAFDLFERPFNANAMDVYFPEIDILDALVYSDATWVYANLVLRGPDKEGRFSGRYAVELDTDLDGRGDWLILAQAPASTTWSTDGVGAWEDANNDVGGKLTIEADSHGGDGYETSVFDAGQGRDPDTAWARISPDDGHSVQLAFKKALIGNPAQYLVGAWAGHDQLNPSLFDLNDRMSAEQAGSPIRDFATYPLKQLPEIDNTCRMSVGFAPTGREPGVCPVEPKKLQGCQLTAEMCYAQGMDYDSRNCKCVVFG